MSTCNPSYPTSGSLDQGANFAKLTATYHGGSRRRNMRSRSRMAGRARGNTRRNRKQSRRRQTRRMRGGSLFTPYAEYPTSMDQMLPKELVADARLSDLNAKFAELPSVTGVSPVAVASGSSGLMPMAGGSRRRRRGSRRYRGGQAPINARSMLLSGQAEETAARLNPQWYTENTVIPGFRGPAYGGRRRRTVRR